MAIPLTVIIGQRGPNGVPSMTGRCDSLRNRLRFYDHSIAERYGYEGMRCGWAAAPDEAQSWARYDQLLRPCEVYNPAGQRVWEGFLYEIKVMLGNAAYGRLGYGRFEARETKRAGYFVKDTSYRTVRFKGD